MSLCETRRPSTSNDDIGSELGLIFRRQRAEMSNLQNGGNTILSSIFRKTIELLSRRANTPHFKHFNAMCSRPNGSSPDAKTLRTYTRANCETGSFSILRENRKQPIMWCEDDWRSIGPHFRDQGAKRLTKKLKRVKCYHTRWHCSTVVSALLELTCLMGPQLLPATRPRRCSRHNPTRRRCSIYRPRRDERLSWPDRYKVKYPNRLFFKTVNIFKIGWVGIKKSRPEYDLNMTQNRSTHQWDLRSICSKHVKRELSADRFWSGSLKYFPR